MDRGHWDPSKALKLDTPGIEMLLDDRTADRVVKDLQRRPVDAKPGAQHSFVGKRTPVARTDQDLMTAMASKLGKTEKVCEAQRKEIKEKTAKIAELEKKVKTFELAKAPEVLHTVEELQADNQALHGQIEEMKQFLHRYGVKWVGSQPQGSLDTQLLDQDLGGAEPRFRYNLPQEIDIRVLARRVQELNIIAEQDAGRWVAQGNVRQFKPLETVPIFFFQNGLILKGFPFRPYSSHHAQSLLSDLLDGYFPFDLKKKYPDGVPLSVVDKTGEPFRPQDPGIRSVEDQDLGFLSKEQFLAQLPDSVIKQGKVIPIKEDLARMLGAEVRAQDGTIEVPTHVDRRLAAGEAELKYTTLRVKSESGKKTWIVRLLYSDSVAELRRLLEPQSETRGRFEIRSTFPARVFDPSDSSTLESLGLVPNYALALRAV